jgi:hypothetical protein
MRCINCGQPLQVGDAFCPQCGGGFGPPPVVTPPAGPGVSNAPADAAAPSYVPAPSGAGHPHRAGPGAPALVVVLVVLVAVGLGITLLTRHHDTAAPPTGTDLVPSVGVSSAAAQPVVPFTPSDDSSSVTTAPNADPDQLLDSASAKVALDGEVAQDRSAAEQLVGYWVPQLSSKREGLPADGITYDYPQIWANFQQLRTEYPNALLIWSGNYVSYKSTDFYVTVVPQQYSDGASANQWCDGAGLAPDDCYAKFLSHSGGSTGTTLIRQ